MARDSSTDRGDGGSRVHRRGLRRRTDRNWSSGRRLRRWQHFSSHGDDADVYSTVKGTYSGGKCNGNTGCTPTTEHTGHAVSQFPHGIRAGTAGGEAEAKDEMDVQSYDETIEDCDYLIGNVASCYTNVSGTATCPVLGTLLDTSETVALPLYLTDVNYEFTNPNSPISCTPEGLGQVCIYPVADTCTNGTPSFSWVNSDDCPVADTIDVYLGAGTTGPPTDFFELTSWYAAYSSSGPFEFLYADNPQSMSEENQNGGNCTLSPQPATNAVPICPPGEDCQTAKVRPWPQKPHFELAKMGEHRLGGPAAHARHASAPFFKSRRPHGSRPQPATLSCHGLTGTARSSRRSLVR
jgi:hypothetical protein